MKIKFLIAAASAALFVGAAQAQPADNGSMSNGGTAQQPGPPPPGDPSVSTPVSQANGRPDENVADTPPTRSPAVGTARSQPPLDQSNAQDNRQPPPSNAPVTNDAPGPVAH